jgi:hypothetical protein
VPQINIIYVSVTKDAVEQTETEHVLQLLHSSQLGTQCNDPLEAYHMLVADDTRVAQIYTTVHGQQQ